MLFYLFDPENFFRWLALQRNLQDGWGRLQAPPDWLGPLWLEYSCHSPGSSVLTTRLGTVQTKLTAASSLQTTASALKTTLGDLFGDVGVNPLDAGNGNVQEIKAERLKPTYLASVSGDDAAAELSGSAFIDIDIWLRRLVGAYRTISRASVEESQEHRATVRLRMGLLIARVLAELAHGGRPEEGDNVTIEGSLFVPLGEDGKVVAVDETTGLPEFLVLFIPGVVGTNKKTGWCYKRINLNPKNHLNPKNRAFCFGAYIVYFLLTVFIPNGIVTGPLFVDYEFPLDQASKRPAGSWPHESYLRRIHRLFKAAGYAGDVPNTRSFRSSSAAHCLRANWEHKDKEALIRGHLGHDVRTSNFERYVANVESYVTKEYGGHERDPLADKGTDLPFRSSRLDSRENWQQKSKPLIQWLQGSIFLPSHRQVLGQNAKRVS
mmetsp:Transcript_18130/g.58582  ORF Transcript_18130/g.58582 Transcript_18130/m.58582 type:complete len:435 (+) Transcript_18130:1390-2694(+)